MIGILSVLTIIRIPGDCEGRDAGIRFLIEELQFGSRCERSNATRLLQSNARDEVY